MTIYKISDDFYEHSYSLIAIHCFLEDYRLAYFLNHQLCGKFKKLPDIRFDHKHISFAFYQWSDEEKDSTWDLIANISKTRPIETINSTMLFSQYTPTKINYLIPERKQTDFFLKIHDEAAYTDTQTILGKINKIPQVTMMYTVDPDQLKSKQNLIT